MLYYLLAHVAWLRQPIVSGLPYAHNIKSCAGSYGTINPQDAAEFCVLCRIATITAPESATEFYMAILIFAAANNLAALHQHRSMSIVATCRRLCNLSSCFEISGGAARWKVLFQSKILLPTLSIMH